MCSGASPDGAHDLLVALVADEQDVEVVVGEAHGLAVHLGHQRAGRVDRLEVAARVASSCTTGRDAVRGEDDGGALGHLVGLVDEDRARASRSVGDDVLVVHDLLAHVDRRAVELERLLDGDDGPVDAGAVAARRREQHALGGLVSRRGHGPIVGRRRAGHPNPRPRHAWRRHCCPTRRPGDGADLLQWPRERPRPAPGAARDGRRHHGRAAVAGAAAEHEHRRVRREDVGAVGRGPDRPAHPPTRASAPPTSRCATPTSTCPSRWPSRSTPSTRCRRPLTQGARVVLQAKPVFWTQRGSLMLDARQIRPVGVGELLARVEHLKRTPRLRGPVRRRPQAAAAVPAPHRRPDLRPGRRRREGRRRERPPPLADRPVRDPRGRRAGRRTPCQEVIGRPAGARRRPRGRRHRHRPRRRRRSRTSCRSATRPWSARSPRPAPRWSRRSATTSTPPCSTTSPTGAPRPPPTPASGWCRTRRPSATAYASRATGDGGRCTARIASERRHLVGAALPPRDGPTRPP